MKTLMVMTFALVSLSAQAQFRVWPDVTDKGVFTTNVSGAAGDPCRAGSFPIDTTTSNTLSKGFIICLWGGSVKTTGFTALATGNWYQTTGDINPSTTCRLEGTPSATTLTPITCGYDP